MYICEITRHNIKMGKIKVYGADENIEHKNRRWTNAKNSERPSQLFFKKCVCWTIYKCTFSDRVFFVFWFSELMAAYKFRDKNSR